MSKVVERNMAELIVIGLFLMILLSSCGTVKFGDHSAWKNSHSINTCR